MKFILPLRVFLNAIQCQADRDVRNYLNGVHISANRVQATNGHYAYNAFVKDYTLPEWVDFDNKYPVSLIIAMKQKIRKPTKTKGECFAVIESNNNDVIVTVINWIGEKIGCYLGEIIEGRFPNFHRIYSELKTEKENISVGFNAEYLAIMKGLSTSKLGSVKMTTHGENKATVFEFLDGCNEYFSQEFILMPMRL